MGWSSLDQIYSPLSGVTNVDALINQDHITYNYELPLEDSIKFTFDISASVASPSSLKMESMNDAQKNTVRSALGYVSSVTGISFSEVGASGDDLVFGSFKSNSDTAGLDYYLTTGALNSTTHEVLSLNQHDTILVNSSMKEEADPSPGNYGYLTILHEIGHALGLKHPFEGSPTLASNLDNQSWTVMSYTPASSDKTPSSYGPIDLAALDWLYGGDGLRNEYGLTVNSKNQPVVSRSPNFDSLGKAATPTGKALVATGSQGELAISGLGWGELASGLVGSGQPDFTIASNAQSQLPLDLLVNTWLTGSQDSAFTPGSTSPLVDQNQEKTFAFGLAQA